MKTLIVLRHGKSDWGAAYGVDHDRPLAKRGLKAAKRVGRFLDVTGQKPDLVLTSTAVRASETARLAAESGEWGCPIEANRRLYEAAPDGVLDLLQGQDDAHDTLLTAGHEPTCSELVSRFVGAADVRFPTAAMARIDFAVGRWTEISFGPRPAHVARDSEAPEPDFALKTLVSRLGASDRKAPCPVPSAS